MDRQPPGSMVSSLWLFVFNVTVPTFVLCFLFHDDVLYSGDENKLYVAKDFLPPAFWENLDSFLVIHEGVRMHFDFREGFIMVEAHFQSNNNKRLTEHCKFI